MIGTSRKGFLGRLTAGEPVPLPSDQRLEGSLATAVWAMANGAGMVRVHDVAPTLQAAKVVGET
jgi:dihydropteroate synthase